MTDLNDLRETIDKCDLEIVEAIEKRFLTVKEVLKYKSENKIPVYDSDRENQVLEKVDSYLVNKEFSEYIETLYIQIMKISKEIQLKE